jgi:hypothetical protein
MMLLKPAAGGQGPLHLGEVRRPVPEREHEAQPERDADPVGAQRVAGASGVGPGVQPGLAELAAAHRVGEPAESAHLHQSQDGDGHQAGKDHEELEYLVVDGRRQAADDDVGEHDERTNHNGRPQWPAEQRLRHERQRVQVDARDQHLRHGEAEGVQQVRRPVEAQPQVLRHAAHLRAVVERHHDDAEEHHRRHRADPVIVDGHRAVLRAVGRHADDLQGAQVGRYERQAGHPTPAATGRRERSRRWCAPSGGPRSRPRAPLRSTS